MPYYKYTSVPSVKRYSGQSVLTYLSAKAIVVKLMTVTFFCDILLWIPGSSGIF